MKQALEKKNRSLISVVLTVFWDFREGFRVIMALHIGCERKRNKKKKKRIENL